jgi:hypothetical protein
MDKEAREKVANQCHDQWSLWMKHLFSAGKYMSDGTWIMPAGYVERWRRQMRTTYSNLSEKEKDSDRVQADKFLMLFYSLYYGEVEGEKDDNGLNIDGN